MTPSNIITSKNLFMPGENETLNYFTYKTLKDARDAFEKDYIIKNSGKTTGTYLRQQKFWI